MKSLVIDVSKCTGCRMCELSCSVNKEKRIAPHLGRVNVFSDWENGLSTPVVCYQCVDAVCMKVCPVGALSRDSRTNAVVLDEKICIGCRQCTVACPFGGIVFSSEKQKILKCDLCNGQPVCVTFCPTGAIKYEVPQKAGLSKRRSIADKALRYFEK
ncbi:MAG: 4Fe-4S dicluster domain-containing protein [Elusimicrobiota bacterium]